MVLRLMNNQQLSNMRFEVYEKLTKSKKKEDKKYNQELLEIIDYAISAKKALENISKEGISHI
jgi:hypothetical protein